MGLMILLASLAAFGVRRIETMPEVVTISGASPSGGLWAVSLDLKGEGQVKEIPDYIFQDLDFEIGIQSFDQRNGDILLETLVPKGIALGTPCRPNRKGESGSPLTFISDSMDFPIYEGNPKLNCLSCAVSSFALFDSKIYFILVGTFGASPNVSKAAQLRVMQSCEKCPGSIEELESLDIFHTPLLFNCSRLVAEIYREVDYEVDGIHLNLKAGKGLKIVQDGYGTSFFFQLFVSRRLRSGMWKVNLNLYHVVQDGAHVKQLRTEVIDGRYALWDVRSIADVDYKDGVLCWTVADRLYCADYDHDRLRNVQMLLFPGEGASSEICTGDPPEFLAVITGVVVAKATDDSIVVVFGCYPQWPGLGGTGMIRLSHRRTKKTMFPLMAGEKKFRAGSLVLFDTNRLPVTCPTEEENAMIKTEYDICIEPRKLEVKFVTGESITPDSENGGDADEGSELVHEQVGYYIVKSDEDKSTEAGSEEIGAKTAGSSDRIAVTNNSGTKSLHYNAAPLTFALCTIAFYCRF